MFITSRVSLRPMFPAHSRLGIARDIAVVVVCIGIMLGFLLDVWSVRRPTTPLAPASLIAPLIHVHS